MKTDARCPRCDSTDIGTHTWYVGREMRHSPRCARCGYGVEGSGATRDEAAALWREQVPDWASHLDHVRSDGVVWDGPTIAPDRWTGLDVASPPRDGSPFWTTDCEVIIENTWLPGRNWMDGTEIDGELFNAAYWAPI